MVVRLSGARGRKNFGRNRKGGEVSKTTRASFQKSVVAKQKNTLPSQNGIGGRSDGGKRGKVRTIFLGRGQTRKKDFWRRDERSKGRRSNHVNVRKRVPRTDEVQSASKRALVFGSGGGGGRKHLTSRNSKGRRKKT